MPIDFLAKERQWHLHDGRISVVLCVLENGWLGQLHLGAPLPPGVSYRHLGPRPFHGFSNRVGEPVALEVPVRNGGDYRIPALDVESPDGSRVLDLRYVDHDIESGKPDIPGLPSTYVEAEGEAETLSIRLRDELTGLLVTTRTTLFADRPVIARSIVLENTGGAPLIVRTAMSASIDLPDANWDLTSLSGTWARERHLERGRVRHAGGRRELREEPELHHAPWSSFARRSSTCFGNGTDVPRAVMGVFSDSPVCSSTKSGPSSVCTMLFARFLKSAKSLMA